MLSYLLSRVAENPVLCELIVTIIIRQPPGYSIPLFCLQLTSLPETIFLSKKHSFTLQSVCIPLYHTTNLFHLMATSGLCQHSRDVLQNGSHGKIMLSHKMAALAGMAKHKISIYQKTNYSGYSEPSTTLAYFCLFSE